MTNAREALKDIQKQSIINGTAEITMDDINAEIDLYRKEKYKC